MGEGGIVATICFFKMRIELDISQPQHFAQPKTFGLSIAYTNFKRWLPIIASLLRDLPGPVDCTTQ